VATDLADGSQAGVSGTPAMFVNGRFLSGAVPFDQLAAIVDDELRRKGITPKKAG
jgi:protein-disulfide isomerase